MPGDLSPKWFDHGVTKAFLPLPHFLFYDDPCLFAMASLLVRILKEPGDFDPVCRRRDRGARPRGSRD